MRTQAVVMDRPGAAAVRSVALSPPGAADVVVDVRWSGISAGTERLLWDGRMPPFPGMGYPLVPGYESAGEITEAGPDSGRRPGEQVFVPGARCFGELRGLFGGAAARLVVAGARAHPVDAALGERAVLLALAATAHHALAGGAAGLVVGHGVLGRLIARLALALGHPPPVVHESDPVRRAGTHPYPVLSPEEDAAGGHARIIDASGDAAATDALVARLARGGELVLAGFYPGEVRFSFAPAFMREARLRVSAEWQPDDMLAVRRLLESGRLSLDGLVTHRRPAEEAAEAYRTAFAEPGCLKMVLDWSGAHA